MLVFSSASLFVRHCEPASTAGPAAVTMAASMSMEWPGRLSFKEPEAWSHSSLMLKPLMPTGHMKPCDANGVLGGAEQKVKGKAQVQAYPPISSRPTYGACMYC